MVTILVHFGQFLCVLVHFGAPHGQPHDPSMTCSESPSLSSVHLFQKWITSVTQNKFEMLCLVMVHLVHFGATPWPLHDLLWLLYPLKCPFIPETDHISHWGQIWDVLLSHGTVTILVHFGAHHGRPHHPSVLNFHQVIKNMFPTHKELLNATNPTFLSQEILI